MSSSPVSTKRKRVDGITGVNGVMKCIQTITRLKVNVERALEAQNLPGEMYSLKQLII